jgi:hypothetical protein
MVSARPNDPVRAQKQSGLFAPNQRRALDVEKNAPAELPPDSRSK